MQKLRRTRIYKPLWLLFNPVFATPVESTQFTSGAFVARLKAEEIKSAASGTEAPVTDNILWWKRALLENSSNIERWYLRAYTMGWEAKSALARIPLEYCHVRTT